MQKKVGVTLSEKSIKPSDLAGIYKDIAELIGLDKTLLLHKEFQGQQITFPKKIFSRAYIMNQLNKEKQSDIKGVASEYGYTERRLRQMIKENREEK
jgi:hypothetical protein